MTPDGPGRLGWPPLLPAVCVAVSWPIPVEGRCPCRSPRRGAPLGSPRPASWSAHRRLCPLAEARLRLELRAARAGGASSRDRVVLTEHSWPLWAVVLLCDFPAPAAASAPWSPLDLSLAGGGGAESPRTQGHAALAGTSSPFACRARRAVGPARTRLRKTRLSPPWSPAVPWAVDLEALGVFKHLFYRTCVLRQRLEARSGPVCVEARPRVPFVTSRAGHVGSVSARPCVLEPPGFGGLCTRRRELGPGMSGPGCGERPGRAGLKR